MTLDEAIAHAREVAEEQRKACDLAWVWDNPDNIKKCAEEHEQLVEWLEELKVIKDGSIPIIHGKAELELHYKEIYNKAIDDFVNACKENIMYKTFGLRECDIEKIAEQLKEQK